MSQIDFHLALGPIPNTTMWGVLQFETSMEISQEYHQMIDKLMDWLKEEAPYELQSYIDMAAHDLAREYLRL